MPKVRPLNAPATARAVDWKQYEARIMERFGTMLLNTDQLGQVIGLKNYRQIKTWAEAEGVTGIPVGKRIKWDARDVAKALANAKLRRTS